MTRLKKIEKALRFGEKETRSIFFYPKDGEDDATAYAKAVVEIRKKESDFSPENYNIIAVCMRYV